MKKWKMEISRCGGITSSRKADLMYPATTRPFHDATLDMDNSKNLGASIPENLIREYRRIKFCGILLEQFCCNALTGEVTFKPVET